MHGVQALTRPAVTRAVAAGRTATILGVYHFVSAAFRAAAWPAAK